MKNAINLIISISIIIVILALKLIIKNKKKDIYKKETYYKNKKLTIFLYILSIIVFFAFIIINTCIQTYDTLTCLLNAISVALIICPFTTGSLYYIFFKDEEKYSHIKTIITNIYDKSIIQKLKTTGINLIILTNEEIDTKIKTISESEIESVSYNKNLIIKTDNYKLLNKQFAKKVDYYFEFKDLNDAYQKIYKARGTYDNYYRSLKFLITVHLPLILSYFFLSFLGFPIYYNILLTCIFKLLIFLIILFIYQKMPYDTDIMERTPKNRNILFDSQELIFLMINSFILFFIINIPYMLILAEGGTLPFSSTLFLLVYIFGNVFITISYLSEKIFLINIIKTITNVRLLIYIILCILIALFLNFTTYFGTRNVELYNFISCTLFSIISIIPNEIVKIARLATKRGKKKNVRKINKKSK